MKIREYEGLDFNSDYITNNGMDLIKLYDFAMFMAGVSDYRKITGQTIKNVLLSKNNDQKSNSTTVAKYLGEI